MTAPGVKVLGLEGFRIRRRRAAAGEHVKEFPSLAVIPDIRRGDSRDGKQPPGIVSSAPPRCVLRSGCTPPCGGAGEEVLVLGDCFICSGAAAREGWFSGLRAASGEDGTRGLVFCFGGRCCRLFWGRLRGSVCVDHRSGHAAPCRHGIACETISRIISGMTRHSANRRRT